MKQISRHRLAALIGLYLLCSGSAALALPSGSSIASGSVGITNSGSQMQITQGSSRAIINWDSFSIGKGESVKIVQPGSSSALLNRITGNSASEIYGSLSANGQVYLINPNGILFGSGSSVNVGSLLASTLGISDSNFTSNNLTFSGSSKNSIINRGSINADDSIALLANNITNSGSLTSGKNILLAAGDQITLSLDSNGLINVSLDAGSLKAGITNSGAITADGGRIILTAKASDNILRSAINNSGVIRARSIETRNGEILILGDLNNSDVSISGTLDASAPTTGNGGSIETSGNKVNIADSAIITTKAANGTNGSWLIDPYDFYIAASGGNISGNALTTALQSNSVTIQTASSGSSCTGATCSSATSGTNGDIYVNDAVSWSANTLTLNAWNNIYINANLNGSGSAKLALEYGQGAVSIGNTSSYSLNGGKVSLPAGNNFSTKQGSDGATVNYTVITSLGTESSSNDGTLQGIVGNLSGNYVLGGDIDATETKTWNLSNGTYQGFTPIGSYYSGLSGTFDGLGHTITNLYINRATTDYVGLFGNSNGTIRNVGLIGVSITGHSCVGGLAGSNAGTISNSYSNGIVTAWQRVGGLVGFNWRAINNSYANGTVTGSGNCVGGLVGDNPRGTISNSYASGAVTGSDFVGGLVGYNVGLVSNSYASGPVSATSVTDYVGELAGYRSGQFSYSKALTTAESLQQSSYTGFDFTNTWIIYNGITTPVLRALQKTVTVTANSGSKVYDGSSSYNYSYSASYDSGAPLSGSVSYSTNTAAINAGSYVITPSGLTLTRTTTQDYQNWGDINYVNGTLTVTPATLTITANNASKNYGQSLTFSGTEFSSSGLVNGETIGSVTLASSGSTDTAASGSYDISASNASGGSFNAGNYYINYVNGTLTVTPAIQSVTAADLRGPLAALYGSVPRSGVTQLAGNDLISVVDGGVRR